MMKISVRKIHNKGDYSKEYVVLDVDERCDAGKYILADTTYLPNGNVSGKLRHMFWMPDGEVNKGDVIVVHTGSGKRTSTANKSGTTTHSFYWGLGASVWNDERDCACLIESATWAFHRVGP